MANRRQRVILGLLVGAVFLVLAFRRIEAGSLVRNLAGFNFWWLPLFVASHLLGLWLRSLRWQAIVNPIRPVGLKVLFPITVRGFLITNILPLKAGDLYRFYALGQKAKLDKTTAMGTLLVERMSDFVGLILISLYLAMMVPLPAAFITALKWTCIVALAITVVFLSFKWLPGLKGALGNFSTRVDGSYLGRVIGGLRQGFAVLGDFRQWVALLALTSLMFLAYYVGILVLLMGFGKGGISPLAPIAVMAFLFWVSLLPQAPAAVGSFEYASMLALQIFGVGREEALALALVMHAVIIVDLLVFNGIILLAQRRSLDVAASVESDRPVRAESSDS
jgi:uncharacterized protein (TIRG00374 family)